MTITDVVPSQAAQGNAGSERLDKVSASFLAVIYMDLMDDTDARGIVGLNTTKRSLIPNLLVPLPLYVPVSVGWVVDLASSPHFVG
jgi:hypothetical protein